MAKPHPANYTRVMPYEVTTEVFEGPFDLLLHLIMREQVDLYEVSLLTVVDAYLAELDRMQRSGSRPAAKRMAVVSYRRSRSSRGS